MFQNGFPNFMRDDVTTVVAFGTSFTDINTQIFKTILAGNYLGILLVTLDQWNAGQR